MISYYVPDMPSTERLIPYLKEIDENHWYSNYGPLYHKFKQRLSNECLSGIAPERLTLVSSGTSAIELALRNLGLKPGSKVLTSSFTFPATVEAIINADLKPVVCDIDQDSWLLTPEIAERNLVQNDITVVVPVAAFGMPVSSEGWARFHERTGLPVVVDSAPAILNQSIDDNLYYAFSLHATKPIGVGEGGVIVCPDKSKAEAIRKMANFGFEPGRTIINTGTNAKISEYHCAVGLAQMDRLAAIKQKRSDNLEMYVTQFRRHNIKIRMQAGIDTFVPASLYVVFERVDAGELFEQLLGNGVETRRIYWPLIQCFPAFKDEIIFASLNFKRAEEVSSRGLALPFHGHLTQSDIGKTVELVVRNLAAKAVSKPSINCR
ncbi:MAG: hypothetical protein GY814_12685 [Gammaproteobacteria bacterium]|nr:hypothetical protein [Gammaproteobacteria bacterium]